MTTIKEKYENDHAFKTLVDMMESLICEGKHTPSELRAAWILAATHYEYHRIRKYIIVDDEAREHLDKLSAIINESLEDKP